MSFLTGIKASMSALSICGVKINNSTSRLKHDNALFSQFEEASKISNFKPSEYWNGYTELIVGQINREGLRGFGRNALLTKGFGDARTYPPSQRIRKLLKYQFAYRPIEILIAHLRQNKSQQKIFNSIESIITEKEFVRHIALELHLAQKSLGINRTFKVKNKYIPSRYLQSILYIELLKDILKRDKHSISLKHILDGNTLDIGGGYGVVSDGFNIYKRVNSLATETTDYILDQFPVSYIANQYLSYRYPSSILEPILKSFSTNSFVEMGNGNKIRVIQASALENITDLNIKYFFNSNSFQEMDKDQVMAYINFIKKNKSVNSFLGCFFYHGRRDDNKIEPVKRLLDENFNLVGSSELRNMQPGIISGVQYLYSIP